ncbi:hypothetical protein FRC01_008892 [Tulasnella sp. 417]|nr:hypothetical protein FRC01_008892 [Tulasnella sp. 417]
MAPNLSPVAEVIPRSDLRTSVSAASAVSTQAAAARSQPAAYGAQDMLTEVQQPIPPIDPPSPPRASRQTPGSTTTHVRSGASFVPRRTDVESAIEGVHGMKSFACGLFDVWPLVGFGKLWGGRRPEAEENVPQPKAEGAESNAEVNVDAFQEVDMMGGRAPPPYQSYQ